MPDSKEPFQRPDTFVGWVDLCLRMFQGDASTEKRRLPSVIEILVTEEENGIPSGRWVPIAEFEPRFHDILAKTTRGWVNLHVDSLEAGVLRMVVEYVSRLDDSARSIPVDKISVNISGPVGGWRH